MRQLVAWLAGSMASMAKAPRSRELFVLIHDVKQQLKLRVKIITSF